MKKAFTVIAAAVIIVAAVLVVTGRLGVFECDICREEDFGYKHKADTVLGELDLCGDCYEDHKELEEGVNDIKDSILDWFE